MANCCAPLPTNITCGVFSMTLRATDTGCLIRSRKATLPQLKNSSIMQASSVTYPSRSGLAPSPTQQFWEASVTITPASTASNALPPDPSIFQAPLFASIPGSQVETTMGFAVKSRGFPAANKPFSNNAVDQRADRAINFRRLSIVIAFSTEIRDKQEKREEQSLPAGENKRNTERQRERVRG